MLALVLIAQSCPTLGDPMDYSRPGSSVHGIFQARILEWFAISFSSNSVILFNKDIDIIHNITIQ